MTHKIAYLPGNGVAPDGAACARRVMLRGCDIFGVGPNSWITISAASRSIITAIPCRPRR